jgi:hypothetical protein
VGTGSSGLCAGTPRVPIGSPVLLYVSTLSQHQELPPLPCTYYTWSHPELGRIRSAVSIAYPSYTSAARVCWQADDGLPGCLPPSCSFLIRGEAASCCQKRYTVWHYGQVKIPIQTDTSEIICHRGVLLNITRLEVQPTRWASRGTWDS